MATQAISGMSKAVVSAAAMLAQCEAWQAVCGLEPGAAGAAGVLTDGPKQRIYLGRFEGNLIERIPLAVVYHDEIHDVAIAGGVRNYFAIDPERLRWVVINLLLADGHPGDGDGGYIAAMNTFDLVRRQLEEQAGADENLAVCKLIGTPPLRPPREEETSLGASYWSMSLRLGYGN